MQNSEATYSLISRRFDLNLLQIFEVLVRERHVTRAAEKLNLSQPAVSHALKKMRIELDDQLLQKTNRGMVPTPRALDMLPQVQHILRLVDGALAPPEPFQPAASDRKFTIASTDYFELMALPDLVASLRRQAPGITVETIMISDLVLRSGLVSGDVDLVVGLEAEHAIPTGLDTETLYREDFVCLTAIDNPAIGDHLTLDEFTAVPHVDLVDLTGIRGSLIDRWLDGEGKSRHIISSNPSYAAAARVVARSDAIVTMHRRMAEMFAGSFPVRIVNPPPGLGSVDFTMVTHQLYAGDPALAWLKSAVRTAAGMIRRAEAVHPAN